MPTGMKAPLAILLAACLCVDGVFSLVCWSCDNVESNSQCWGMQTCSEGDNYCATTYSGGGIGGYSTQSISKGCVPVCPNVGVDIGIAAISVHCCSSFLCNISGANSIQINHLVLALALLASFFYLFGSRL
ncbi:lymphocyte antigen 6E-like [Pseudonaja textilis]|uniref:lymphocyte antigen 6E-like n=1 Tax=Pseudonaja textilis TaxID=8673 RepID=UPI000EA9B9C4|nr:lymphocyte antigen 6E-like [Pseudonaja textilis]